VGDPIFYKSLAGRQLKSMILEAGIPWEEVQLTNIVWCWLPARKNRDIFEGVRTPTKEEVKYCMSAHLVPHLKKTGAYNEGKTIITVGNSSARNFRGISGSVEPFIGVFDTVTDP
jgi:uracil-DNA glycosylase family 4